MPAYSRFAVAFATAIAVSGATAPEAAAAVQYTSAWFLGDSLSDPGNLYKATNGTTPASPPYYQGQFSNGPVWAEHIAQEFTDEGLQTGNFAYGGATAITNADNIPDLPLQIAMFGAASTGKLGAAPVAHLFFGANDVFGAIAAYNGDQAAFAGTVATAANAVVAGVLAMYGLGVNDFMVFNLPALDQTPFIAKFNPQGQQLASAGTQIFNNTLKAGLGALPLGINVTTIDTFALFADVLKYPGDYGITNVTDPCYISGPALDPACVPDQWAFFDAVHPNQVLHTELAKAVGAYVAPVPLPLPGLLLVGGIVLLGGLRKRARA